MFYVDKHITKGTSEDSVAHCEALCNSWGNKKHAFGDTCEHYSYTTERNAVHKTGNINCFLIGAGAKKETEP